MKRPVGFFDHLFGLTTCVVYVAMLMATANDLAMTRDESTYVHAAEQYGAWLKDFADDPATAMGRESVDRFWNFNHEHPSLAKLAFAVSNLAHEKWEIFDSATKAHRFPGMLSAGLLLWLVYIFGARSYGRTAGVFAALALAAMPRPFYHAHLNCFDVPIVLMLVWTTYCYWRSLEKPGWAIWTGIAFGLALETKHNAWILPGVLLIHFVFVVLRERRRRRAGRAPRVTYKPWWALGMLLLGPPIFFALWPWMWFDTIDRWNSYAGFHINHVHYVYEYWGESYWQPPFPVHAPFVQTWFTVPATTVILALAGIAIRARAMLPAGLESRLWRGGRVEADSRATDVLFIGSLLAPMVAIALPSSPIFGGTKHWITAYPYLALFAGAGFRRMTQVVQREAYARLPRLSRMLPVVLALVCLAPAVVQTAHSHPFGLTHYTWAAGGVPGGADHGMNRQFWGFTHGPLGDWFSEVMPDGGAVYLCDATWMSWRMSQRDGMIAENIRGVGDLSQADYALVHHEEHFAEVDFQAWMAYGTVAPVRVLTYDGVPVVSVYENPRHRARAARREDATNRGRGRAPTRPAERARPGPRLEPVDARGMGGMMGGEPVAPLRRLPMRSGSRAAEGGPGPVRQLDGPSAADVDPGLEAED